MKLISNNGSKPAKVICMRVVSTRFHPDKCQHVNMEVDEELNSVKCSDCSADLNPINLLARLARDESRYGERVEEMKKLKAELEARSRCKCKHCQKMTPINY